MMIPQLMLMLPEARAARNQNSIGDRMEKKPWEKPGSVGGPVPLRPDKPVVCSNCSKVRVLWRYSTAWYGTVRYGSVRVGLHFHRSLVPL